jgi:protein TonB
MSGVRRRLDGRCIAASLLLHLAGLLGVLMFIPRAAPIPESQPVPVVELLKESGAEGARAGGAAVGGEAAGSQEAAAAQEALVESKPQEELRPTPAAKLTPPRPKPVAKPKPVPTPTPVEPLAVAEAPVAPPPPATASPPEPIVAAQSPKVPVVASTGVSGGSAGVGSAGGAGAGADVGQGSQGRGAGAYGDGQGPGDDYLSRVRRWIAKYKKYPPEALRQKQEGTVMVAFTLARDGTVLAVEIERSSGFPLIDQAVHDMLHRASPVPPVPAHYTGERLSIAIPVRFSLALLDKLF